ncbi:MAG: molybdate ABC transporter substrate-binding protein [Acidobacteria bacterium]|nr:molybdate ABC transporter substrate-binding protein [Acidobacteriota bacterium]
MNIRGRALITSLALAWLSHAVVAQQITVAAAADLQSAMQDLVARFEKQTNKTVKVIYGSSGNFFQQIQNGAPFDMFFSANVDYPKQLESAGLTMPGTYYQYARGKIVVWVPKDSKIDLSTGLKALLDPNVRKIAIANPLHAPYGQAALSAMKKEGVYEEAKDKFVLGESISQTASFILSGSADIAVMALSLALSPNMKDGGQYVVIPADEYPPINQACVVLSSSKDKALAQRFLSYIKGPEAARVLTAFGFDVSGRDQK